MAAKLWMCLALALVATAEIPEEEDVLVLGQANFQEALDLYPDLLVEFYAPWCGHCKKLAPEYAKAAGKLKAHDPPIRIAKVDATENSELARKYQVRGYPTLKYFINKQPTDYTGGRTEDTIISWILKKRGPAVTVAESAADLQKLIDENSVVVTLFAQKDSTEFETFEFAAKSTDGPTFVLATDAAVASEHGVTAPALVMFKAFDDKKVTFTDSFNTVAVNQFVANNRYPWLMPFNDETKEYIFQKKNNALLFFRSKKDSATYDEFLTTLGKELKGELAVAVIDLNEAGNQKVGESYGVKAANMPRAILAEIGAQKKYKFEGEQNEAGVRQFISDWRKKALQPFLKSDPIPTESHEKNVRVLVGENFESIVFDSEKDVLVEFYAPWCGHCKKLAPEYEKLATELKDIDSVIVAKMDSTANEVKGVSIRGFPTLKFYSAKNKKGKDFDGERTAAGMKEWILKNVDIPVPQEAGRDKTDL